MRLRNVKNAKEIVENHDLVIKENVFDNNKELRIEIGMGKGDFIIQMAKMNPDINFIGIERYESVLVRALEKVDEVPSNLRFMCMDAKEIDKYFNNNVSVIYLNFSDPWPKKRHSKRRLTSELFLKAYDKISKGNTHIIMKTDNKDLVAYSIVSLNNYGYYFNDVNLNLNEEDSVVTEYERKFRDLKVTINYIDAIKR